MKAFLRKTEARKIALFALFTAGVLFLLHLDARAEPDHATAAATVELPDP
ncbi:MAG: hypothetical protein V2I57_08295 [Xanthomonadales bacterium]|jgi:hypothetical protein|nr:hypothetical protein [Xanthomonadales bacterium]